MADEIDGTTCVHFFSVDQKLRIVRTQAEASESTDIDSSNEKTVPQQCLSVKSQINAGGHVALTSALSSTHCIPAGKTVEDQKCG